MEKFKEIKIKDSHIDPFELKEKWMLITAKKEDGKVNTMTASWGGFGIMWNKEVVFVVIRPQRYTKEFVDNAESFSLTFFDKAYKKQLGYLGRVSGKSENKIEEAGLTIAEEDGIPYFEEAATTILVRKLYAQPLGEEFFIDAKPVADWYPEKDFHTLYIAEVTKILVKESDN